MSRYLYLLLLLSFALTSNATKYPLENLRKDKLNIIDGSQYKAGDTLVVSPGHTAGIQFSNLRGNYYSPIVIINGNGRVIISEKVVDGIKFERCAYVHITGTGSKSHEYGFIVTEAGRNSAGNGVSVAGLSTDIEIDHFEIKYTGFAGIIAKTDPKCDDPKTWRRNGFKLKNLHIHNNYIHNTKGEGMYIGYTGGYKYKSKVKCGSKGMVYGHWLEHVNIHHNKLENIGWDGIQVNLANKHCHIHHNTIINYAKFPREFHSFGMSIGAGVYQIYNNTIAQNKSNLPKHSSAIQLISTDSGTKVFNNIINNTGGHALYIHSRHKYAGSKGLTIAHNTIVKTGSSAIMYNSQVTTYNNKAHKGNLQLRVPFICQNNLIVSVGTKYQKDNTWKGENENYVDFMAKDVKEAMEPYIKGNVMSQNAYSLNLKDPGKRNYALKGSASEAHDAGEDLGEIKFDFEGFPRKIGDRPDAGAYEFKPWNKICIKGYVLDLKGRPVNALEIKGFPKSVKTDQYGMFSYLVDKNWKSTIRPVTSKYTMIPEKIDIPSVQSDPKYFFFIAQNQGSTTSIEKEKREKINVFPNPSPDGNFNIELPQTGDYRIKVINLRGQTIMERDAQEIHNGISVKEKGLFLLQLFEKNKFVTQEKILSM